LGGIGFGTEIGKRELTFGTGQTVGNGMRIGANVLLGYDLVVEVGYNGGSPALARLLEWGEWIVGRGYVRNYREGRENCPAT
jgi:hypothetical protein